MRNHSSLLALSLSQFEEPVKENGRKSSCERLRWGLSIITVLPLQDFGTTLNMIFIVQNFWKNGAGYVHNLNTRKGLGEWISRRGVAPFLPTFSHFLHTYGLCRGLNFDMEIVWAKYTNGPTTYRGVAHCSLEIRYHQFRPCTFISFLM